MKLGINRSIFMTMKNLKCPKIIQVKGVFFSGGEEKENVGFKGNVGL